MESKAWLYYRWFKKKKKKATLLKINYWRRRLGYYIYTIHLMEKI